MKLLITIFGLSLALMVSQAEGFILDSLFAFPSTRRGRATPPAAVSNDYEGSSPSDTFLDSISVSKNTDTSDDIIQQLMKSVLQAAEEEPRPAALKKDDGTFRAEFFEETPIISSAEGRLQTPRRVDEMKDFGEALDTDDVLFHAEGGLPQLAATGSRSDQFLSNGAPDVMNLRSDAFLRQNDPGSPIEAPIAAPIDAGGDLDLGSGDADNTNNSGDDNEIRCVPKVMQIEETVYDREIKCHHSVKEKCHMTYITDYRSSTQEKCETTYKKNCHIIFKAMPFNEKVNICHTPIVRKCSNESFGPEICSTQYETNCETRYKTYEIEQDEPVCKMEIMKKCQDVTIPLNGASRRGRQFGDLLGAADALTSGVENSDQNNDLATSDAANNADQNAVTVDQVCEEWPVQKCTLEKKLVKKVHPESECRKVPRQVCIPNNCQMVQGEEVCRDEDKVQIQNVPQEECALQPEENCRAEAVLVPRLVPKPNCVKVPKEICVNTKTNPRRVKKPVVKQWCYNPKDLKDLKASNAVPSEVNASGGGNDLPGESVSRTAGSIFSRISKLLFSKK